MQCTPTPTIHTAKSSILHKEKKNPLQKIMNFLNEITYYEFHKFKIKKIVINAKKWQMLEI